jgi:thiol-disulfide isomerase/thioredoxin
MKLFKITLMIFILSLFFACNKEKNSTKQISDQMSNSQNMELSSQTTSKDWGDAPDFTLKDLAGGTFILSSFKGKVIIVDFWATWCPPCRMEIPNFVELYSQYKDKGLEIVGVTLDEGGENVVSEFRDKNKINYTLVLGNEKVTQDYGGIRGIPTTFIIDKKGNIVNKHIGYTDKQVFEEEIKSLL